MFGHNPTVIDEFNGLWKRGDTDSCPQDHFPDCNNIAFIEGGFRWRDGIDPYFPFPDVVRVYTFTQETGESLLILDSNGVIFDSDFPTTPILTIPAMTDFGYLGYAGRAYISPCNGITGLASEYVYVYDGNGVAARRAAGEKPTDTDGALAAANSGGAGHVESGIHVFAVVYETDTGFLTAIGPTTLPTVTAPGGEGVNLTNVPVSPNGYVTKVHVIATKAINPAFYTGDTRGYQFFFIPNQTVANGTTSISGVSFFDSELLDDATYLLDMFEQIPAQAGLGLYHNRMIGWGSYADPSVIRVSVAGEVEAFNQVDGLVIFPLDGNPVRNAQEFRDVLYAFKHTKTNAWSDNGDVPSSWAMTTLDQGIGAGLHSISKVLDSEGVNVDFLLIGSFTGILMFNGAYQAPELTYKIRDFWLALDRESWNKVQILNDSVRSLIYIVLPDGAMLHGDYSNGLSPEKIRWSPWNFELNVTCIALINGPELIIASDGELL